MRRSIAKITFVFITPKKTKLTNNDLLSQRIFLIKLQFLQNLCSTSIIFDEAAAPVMKTEGRKKTLKSQFQTFEGAGT